MIGDRAGGETEPTDPRHPAEPVSTARRGTGLDDARALGVVAALNSVLAGSMASDVAALLGGGLSLDLPLGAAVSLVSAAMHVRYAGRSRRIHVPGGRGTR